MTHERQHSHATSSADATTDHDDLEPGRLSRSALMRKPDHAIASGLLQRAARDANGVADGAEHAVAAASSSSGSPLPETLMRKFESSLGADLGGVRVHTGEASAVANDAVGAKAYTVGQDIHFGAGHYDPSSPGGEHLLAHEVAHTVQQGSGAQRMQFKLAVSSPGDSLEHEADAAADAMVSGAPAQVSGGSGVARMIQREATSIPPVTVKAFVPQLAVSPAKADVDLGSEVVEIAKVRNANQADQGTKFQWAWNGLDAAFSSGASPAAGATAALKATPKQVLKSTITPQMTMTEPDGHVRTTVATPVPVNVRKPAAQWIVNVVPGNTAQNVARDIGANPMKLFRNDTLEAVAFVDNVKDLNAAGITATVSRLGVNVPASWVFAGNKATFKILADKPGRQSYSVHLHVPGMAEPITHTSAIRVVMSVADVQATAATASSALGKKFHRSAEKLNNAATAFEVAKKAHDATIKDSAALGQLVEDLLVGAFFAGIAGAAGGAIGNTIKHKLIAQFAEPTAGKAFADSGLGGAYTDSGKDITKFAVKALEKLKGGKAAPVPAKAGAGPAGSAGGGGKDGVGHDPALWARGIASKLHAETANCHEMLEKVLDACRNAEPTEEIELDADPVASINADMGLESLEGISEAPKDYAIGLWKTWVANYGYTLKVHVFEGGSLWIPEDNTNDTLGVLRKGVSEQCGKAEADAIFAQQLPAAKQKAEAEAKEENKDTP